MAQPYVGEIRMFAGNFAPAGWEFCGGQLLPISENETLFQLIGTTYGGDGESTFALPDLQGRIPIHMGTGPSGTTYQLAEKAGVESVTLTTSQMPIHAHGLIASTAAATQENAAGNLTGQPSVAIYNSGEEGSLQAMSSLAIDPTGGSQAHDNFQPYLCVNFIISLFGIFPSIT